MDKDIAIKVEGLGKKYLIGHESVDRSGTLRDAIVRGVGNLTRMGKSMLRGGQIVAGDEIEEFWALRDLDFEIKRGDVVGVIGRNGAGKSTLLKILSRITEPTEGRVQINGRVASLLEVGTGFHPELSGRENVYLNGAILGMTHAEIRRKFDEIVAFSGVEKFLDTPVKRYSSGMYVRLAFAVAAHLEPEILIVDEVLAVGDAEFQKKCLGKMQDVAGEGRTVVFVSHNLTSVQSLCENGIHLQSGNVRYIGPMRQTIDSYMAESMAITTRYSLADNPYRSGIGRLRFSDIEFSYDRGMSTATTACPLTIRLTMRGDAVGPALPGRVGITFINSMGELLFNCSTDVSCAHEVMLADGSVLELTIPALPLTGGEYTLSLFMERATQIEDWIEVAARLTVDDAPYYGTSRNAPNGWEGKAVLVDHGWTVVGEQLDA